MNCFFSFTWTFTAPFFNIHTKLPLLYVLTRLTFSIGRYGNVALFFLHCPLNFAISSEFFDISTSYQLPFTISRLCHPLMPQTDRDHKSFNREKTRGALPKNMNTHEVLYRHFIPVQLQSERFRSYYFKPRRVR